MKKKLFVKIGQIICPEFIKEYEYYKDNSDGLAFKLRQSKRDEKHFKTCIEKINLIARDEDKIFLGIDENKETSLVIIYMECDIPPNEFNIIVENTYTIKKDIVYKLEFEFLDNNSKIHIIDNHATHYNKNKGNGSIGLKHLTYIAKAKNCKKITGSISFTDWDRVNILEKFYKNQGFEVKLDHENKHGYIVWINQDYVEKEKSKLDLVQDISV